MSTMQEMTNSAFRAMLDNAAISAGPQMEVNLDLLSEDEDPREVHPFKVWMRTGTGNDAQALWLTLLISVVCMVILVTSGRLLQAKH